MKCLGTIAAVSAFAMASLAAMAPQCSAKTYYVDQYGNDSAAGTSAAPVATLLQAVYLANQDYAGGSTPAGGDIININGNGKTYQLSWAGGGGVAQGNPVTVNTHATSAAPLIIQTTPGQSNAVLIGGNWLGTQDNIDLNGTYITVQNLTSQNAMGVNIDIPNGDYCTVQNCIATGAGWAGIMIGSTASNHQLQHDAVLNCVVHDNNQANNPTGKPGQDWAGSLVLSNCTNCNLQYNTVYHNYGEGIGMYSFGQTTTNNWVDNNTVYDNWSVEVYICNSTYNYVWNNLIYADSNAILRPLFGGVSFPAIGIASDNESTTQLCYGSQIYNNIVIGGQSCFRAANQNTVSGFYAGGLNGYKIYNNVFYNTSPYNTTSVNPPCIQVDNDPGNNFTWENNIVWETNGIVPVAVDGGGGTQIKTTNCWDGTGGFNMNGPSDVLLWNTNPGFVSAGSLSASGYVLNSTSPLISAGTNATSVLTFDYNWSGRPSTGPWAMGAFYN